MQSISSSYEYLTEENENNTSKRQIHAPVHCSVIYNSNSKIWKQPECHHLINGSRKYGVYKQWI